MSTEINDPNQFSDETREALANLILSIADTKRLLGIRYAEWCDGAPALEASVAASAMAQDELGHSRALLPLLKEFAGVDPGIPEEAPRTQYLAPTFLDRPFSTWPTFVAANVLIGQALTTMLKAAQHSCYIPLRTRAVKIPEEERFHWLHGEGWFKRLAGNEKEGADLAAQVEEILPQALCWFGQVEDDRLAREGIVNAGPEELRKHLLDDVAPLIRKSQAGDLVQSEGEHWDYTERLPWSRYNPLTHRIEPAGRG